MALPPGSLPALPCTPASCPQLSRFTAEKRWARQGHSHQLWLKTASGQGLTTWVEGGGQRMPWTERPTWLLYGGRNHSPQGKEGDRADWRGCRDAGSLREQVYFILLCRVRGLGLPQQLSAKCSDDEVDSRLHSGSLWSPGIRWVLKQPSGSVRPSPSQEHPPSTPCSPLTQYVSFPIWSALGSGGK